MRIGSNARATRAQLASFAIGSSVFAIAMGMSSPAAAQCAPDPTVSGGTTDCAGTDSDGLNVATTSSKVVVASGARVTPGANAAGIVTSNSGITLSVAGEVAGGSRPGVIVTNGAPYYGPCDPYAGASVIWCPGPFAWTYPAGTATITLAEGGSISGANAVRVQRRADNNSFVRATIDNSGTLTGSAGPALIAVAGTDFEQIDNRATGTIGGISGEFQRLGNAGTIDGGNLSAVAAIGRAWVTNSGSIVSASSDATIRGGSTDVTNTGTIRNAGTGAAIDASRSANIQNQADATIGTAGSVAIRSGGQLNLVNAGTINGSVIAGPSVGFSGSTVDNLAGTINGDVLFGGSNDILRARFDSAAGRIARISGTIDGGAGIDQLVLGVDANATLGEGALPVNFEQLGLRMTNDAVVTLASTDATSHGITATGSGRLVNTVALNTIGTAIRTDWSSYDAVLDVENGNTITANLSSTWSPAVQISRGSFTNSGTVTGIGGAGVSVESSGQGQRTLANSGTITGDTTGASVNYARLDNSGTIQSTGGTGLSLYYNDSSDASVNSGTIIGATTGASVYLTRLVNSGSIVGGTTGILADQLRLDNQAGGVVRGGTTAIASNAYGSGGSTIRNAGLIDGNVDLARTGFGSDYTRDVYIDAGGTVNGALRMGGGDDLLVVRMTDDASRPFAGITGGIDMGEGTDTIRYVAATDRSAAITVPSGFDAVAYEVADGARLTLTAADPLMATLGLTGNGTIDLTADITTSGTAAIDLSGLSAEEMLAGGRPFGNSGAVNADLTVVSRGALTFGNGQPFSSSSCAVSAASASFENAGSITTRANPDSWSSLSAICGGGTVTNSGTIRVDGGLAVSGAARFNNIGLLTDIPGSGGTGVIGTDTVTNSGTIVVDGMAVTTWGTQLTVTNSGTIESRNDTTINLGAFGTLTNEATGIIRSSEVAITGLNGEVVNRGRIIGDVQLRGQQLQPQQPQSPFALLAVETGGSRYVDAGGTLEGDLRFFGTDNSFVQSGATTGVTGRIIGSDGFDRIVLSRDGSGSFSGASRFEQLDVEAGQWTLTGATNVIDTSIAGTATLIGTTALLTGDIANAGTLRIAQDFDGTFGGTLTGNGALVKAGAGTVAMGDQLGFTGNTTVLGGRLLMTGQTAARLNVIGGVLGGTGSVGALAVGNGGTVSPGDNGIGTLNVAGNFAQGAGSTYLANVTAGGLSDRIVVGGTATLAQGARLVLSGTAGPIGTRYTLLTAAGGLSGTYDVTQTSDLLELRLVYAPNSLFADVARSVRGLGAIAATGNQRAAAGGLTGLTARNAAYAAVTLEPNEAAARVALDQLSGEAHASLGAAMVLDARIVEDAVLTRTLASEPGSGIWGSMIGNRATDGGDGQSAALTRSTFGAVGGVDFGLDGARIGVAGGYTRTDFSVDARLSNGQTETVHLLGYAGGEVGPIALRAGVGYAWADNRVNRTVGFVGERLRADYDGNTLYTFAEAGHGFALGGGSVQPFVGLESYRIRTDAFSETGGSAALNGADRSESFAFTRAGLRAETPIVEGISARANAAWLRRIDGETPSVRAAYAGATSSFEVSGVPLSRDAASLGLDVVWAPVSNIRIVSGYNGRIGGRGEDNSFRLMASVGF